MLFIYYAFRFVFFFGRQRLISTSVFYGWQLQACIRAICPHMTLTQCIGMTGTCEKMTCCQFCVEDFALNLIIRHRHVWG